MLYSSLEFILLFLPITFFLVIALARLIDVRAILILASLTFYGAANIEYVPLIIFSIIVNYAIGKKVNEHKPWLIAGIFLNLALLGYFKYSLFIVENINLLFQSSLFLKSIVLPIGISFYTFQQIAFLVDSYKEKNTSTKFIDYSLFVTFFPQLIAGPIVHHKSMVTQFSGIRQRMNIDNFVIGLSIFSFGLAKKVLLADGFGEQAEVVFNQNDLTQLSFFEAWVGALSYTFQIYFDFSGYCDMAVGLARIFGLSLPINFFSPYKSDSIIEFWRRWHMTLSRFLRDYVYIPFGGNQKGELKRYRNLLLTMLIGGFWHGANWTFVVWGAYHGCLLGINHLFKQAGLSFARFKWVSIGITFLSIVVGWVMFRAASFDQGIMILNKMFSLDSVSLPMELANYANFMPAYFKFDGLTPNGYFIPKIALLWLLLGAFVSWFMPNVYEIFIKFELSDDNVSFVQANSNSKVAWKPNIFWLLVSSTLLFMGLMAISLNTPPAFLYYQF